jgi:hypothetical protein
VNPDVLVGVHRRRVAREEVHREPGAAFLDEAPRGGGDVRRVTLGDDHELGSSALRRSSMKSTNLADVRSRCSTATTCGRAD